MRWNTPTDFETKYPGSLSAPKAPNFSPKQHQSNPPAAPAWLGVALGQKD